MPEETADTSSCIIHREPITMFHNKPIIGIAGGIGSGKSFVAALFAELGCLVLNADEQVRLAYRDATVKKTIKKWWGPLVFSPDGEVDRSAVARKVFSHPDELKRLENLLHPIVIATRDRLMSSRAEDPAVVGFVWDIPLLFETEMDKQCDRIVFVETPLELRQQRVLESRGWSAEQLDAREKLQMPLDKKRLMSHDVIVNAAGADDDVRVQVKDVLSRILATRIASD